MDKKAKKHVEIDNCTARNMTFTASLKSKFIKVFVGIIKAMNAVNSSTTDSTEMQLSDNGLKYIVEESKSFQASAYMKKEFFDSFELRLIEKGIPMIGFGVNLASFTELLTAILDNDLSSMKIVYFGNENNILFTCDQTDSGEGLLMKGKMNHDEMKEDTVGDEDPITIKTEYFVKTMQSIEPIDFRVESPHLVHTIMISAYDLHGIINDFDRSMEELVLKVTERRMTFKSVGILEFETIAKLDRESEIFYKYDFFEASKFSYKFSCFKTMLKTLLMSTKAVLTTHADGMLLVNLMVRNEDGDDDDSSSFIEYNIIPNLPDEESENEES